MAQITNGGRIVPILTGTDAHNSTLEGPTSLNESIPRLNSPIIPSSIPPTAANLLQEQQAKRAKSTQHASLEMASLKERGLFALPTEGDGKSIT